MVMSYKLLLPYSIIWTQSDFKRYNNIGEKIILNVSWLNDILWYWQFWPENSDSFKDYNIQVHNLSSNSFLKDLLNNGITGSYTNMSTESGKREIDEVDDDDCIGPLPEEAVKTKKRKGKAIFLYLE